MKYPVWFLRLLFAAWMIPAGVNHFFPLFPQPMGNQPLSMELIHALLDSHLFDLVKAVELIAGLGLLFAFYTPLALLICMPVSFGVFYWDAPLEGWTSGAAMYGYAVLLVNSLLCLAYYKSYSAMFALRAQGESRKQLVLGARIVFGAWMVIYAANTLFLSLWPVPGGSEPLAVQLMTSLNNSHLIDVALVMQLVAGVLILAGVMLPLALCVQMPITTCALYWALILDHQLLGSILTLAAFALNGLLMLAYLPYYKGVLERRAIAAGEAPGTSGNYDALFISPEGRAGKAAYIPALLTILAVFAFYNYIGLVGTSQFSVLILLYPMFTLLAQRLRDMGHNPWLLIVSLVLMLLTFGVYFDYFSLGADLDGAVTWIALIVTTAFLLWGCLGPGKTSQLE